MVSSLWGFSTVITLRFLSKTSAISFLGLVGLDYRNHLVITLYPFIFFGNRLFKNLDVLLLFLNTSEKGFFVVLKSFFWSYRLHFSTVCIPRTSAEILSVCFEPASFSFW